MSYLSLVTAMTKKYNNYNLYRPFNNNCKQYADGNATMYSAGQTSSRRQCYYRHRASYNAARPVDYSIRFGG